MVALTPSMVFFGVRSLVRLGTAARDAYQQNIRDEPIEVRLPSAALVNPLDFALGILMDEAPDRLERPDGDLSGCFLDDGSISRDPQHQSRLIAAAEAYWPAGASADGTALDLDGGRFGREPASAAGYVTLKQWAEGDEPPGGLARVGIALADIALDFAGTNPGVFGVGSNAEKLIAAVTLNLRELLPDPDAPADWKGEFSERVTSIFFQAGLQALGDHADAVIEEDHLAALTKGVVKPFVELFEDAADDAGRLPNVIAVRDTLFGPVARAAVTTLAEHQTAFLGRRFDPEEAIGAVTTAVLTAAAEDADVRKAFDKEGLARIYAAVLGVVVERPQLFVTGTGDRAELSRDLVQKLAATLKDAPPPFNDTLASDLAVDVIEVVGEHASRRLDEDRPWEAAAAAALDAVVAGLKAGVGDGQTPLEAAFTRSQLRDVFKVVLLQAAKTPGMITGTGANGELKNIVASVASVLATTDANLLSHDAWRDVVSVAVAEAAKNPGALFSIDADTPERQLAIKLISDLLAEASQRLGENRDRRIGVLLFGDTLRDAIVAVLRAGARNLQAASMAEGQAAARELAERLNTFAESQQGAVGAAQWSMLYRRFVAQVIAEGQVPAWTDAQLIEFLGTPALEETAP